MPNTDFSILRYPPGLTSPSNILIHHQAQTELMDLVKQNPQTKTLLRTQFGRRLDYLSQNLGRETQHDEWFEQLKGVPYKSMRFAHVKLLSNLRIIYGIADNKAYLLVAFAERNSSDYTRALKAAERRAAGIL